MSTKLEVGTGSIGLKEAQPREADLRKRLEDKFNWAFGEVFQRRNQEADTPRVKVKMFYSYHATPEDLSGLIAEFAEKENSGDSIDAYFPEAFGWTQKDLRLFNKFSFGDIALEELDKRLKKYSPALRKNIKGTHFYHIPVGIIDVPSGHSLIKDSDEVWNYSPSYDGDFKQVLNYTRNFLGKLAHHNNKREDYMLSQITPEKIEKLLKTYKELANKKEINILLSLGIGHAPLPYDYPESSLTNQGILMSRYGKKIDDDLAAKIFLESFMENLFSTGFGGRLISDSRKFSMYKRKILSQFSYQDAERIFEYIKSHVDESGESIFPRDEFNRMFDKKGLTLPRSERELDAFLAKSDSPQRVSTE